MLKIIIVLLLSVKKALFDLNLTNNTIEELIANGEVYDPSKFPYVVAIKIFSNNRKTNSICTGSLIKELYVLTAAHCVHGSDKSVLEVYQGSTINNNDFRKVVELYIHSGYDPESPIVQGDLSVFKLESAFPNVKKYIQIGGKPKDFANHKALKCISIGFGVMDTTGKMGSIGYMITTDVRHGETECKGYQSVQIKDTWPQYLCSEPTSQDHTKMTCPGDSGGPMICNNKLYGVCSFYVNYEGGKNDCGVPNMQTIHVFINYHLKWVNDIISPKEDENNDENNDDEKKDEKKKKKKEKKKKKKKSSGNSIKPYHKFHRILTILLYCVLTFI